MIYMFPTLHLIYWLIYVFIAFSFINSVFFKIFVKPNWGKYGVASGKKESVIVYLMANLSF